MPKKIKQFVRLNSRIREDQMKAIKDKAKSQNKTEGEALRDIIDDYIISNKPIVKKNV